ncbi:MAG: SDR family NAD(P)-dependent oxidoreductase [Desulfobacterales bacterium]|nr:SDR family NAD(P)-dependent oxidoreductase [Desulfobacterales bacterium]
MIALQGKKAIVTGGAMGIGLATCRRLIKEGCEVTIWDLSEKDLDAAAKELKEAGGIVFPYRCDVADKNRVHELAVQARKDMGRVDILINNAGYVRHGMFWEQPVENAVKQMDVNVNALFYAIHEFLPEMMQRNSGHIVNVSSGVAVTSAPGLAAYTTSKWAVWGLTDVLRLEMMTVGKNGVKFTSVHPGNILTGMFEGFSLNFLGRLIAPPVKNHDIIAKGIVEKGLKKQRHLVVIPWQIYIGMMLRGLIPDFILGRMALMVGLGSCVKNYKGRKGYVHSTSENDPGKN